MRTLLLIAVVLLSVQPGARAADPFNKDAHPVTATLIADVDAVVPGQSFTVGLLFKIKPHWHTYWKNPGDTGMATTLKLDTTSSKGLSFGSMQWPLPHALDADGFVSFAYENEVLHLIPVKASRSLAGAKSVKLVAKAEWLVCKEVCLEGKADLSLTLPVRNAATAAKPANAKLFDTWRARLPLAAKSKTEAKFVASIKQAKSQSGKPLPQFTIHWKEGKRPKQAAWFPIPVHAFAIEKVSLKSEGQKTVVSFHPQIFTPDKLGEGAFGGVLVFKDAKDRRIGIQTPLNVSNPE